MSTLMDSDTNRLLGLEGEGQGRSLTGLSQSLDWRVDLLGLGFSPVLRRPRVCVLNLSEATTEVEAEVKCEVVNEIFKLLLEQLIGASIHGSIIVYTNHEVNKRSELRRIAESENNKYRSYLGVTEISEGHGVQDNSETSREKVRR
jgi:hypothetical protein